MLDVWHSLPTLSPEKVSFKRNELGKIGTEGRFVRSLLLIKSAGAKGAEIKRELERGGEREGDRERGRERKG